MSTSGLKKTFWSKLKQVKMFDVARSGGDGFYVIYRSEFSLTLPRLIIYKLYMLCMQARRVPFSYNHVKDAIWEMNEMILLGGSSGISRSPGHYYSALW